MSTDIVARGMAARALTGGGTASAAPISGTGETVTVSTPLVNLTQTWNAGAITFTAATVDVTDTASAGASKLLDLKVGGASKFTVDKAGNANIASDAAVMIGGDVQLHRDNPGELSLRNGANPQSFGVFSFYTSASDYRVGYMNWQSGNFTIGTATAGSGGSPNMMFWSSASILIRVNGSGSSTWTFNSAGDFGAATDGGADIGSSSARRIRNLFATGHVRTGVGTVASLPAASTATAGARRMVTDANTPVFGEVVVGGGSTPIPVYSDGTAWRVG